MMLLFMTLCCVLFGSSAGIQLEEKCYGRSFSLPFEYAHAMFRRKLYFTPSTGGPARLIMDNGEAKDPRIHVRFSTAEIKDLNERDDGTFSTSFSSDKLFDVIRLKILDCADKIEKNYGSTYVGNIPSEAEFLEFTPSDKMGQTKVLWNRTNPQTNKQSKLQIKRYGWEMKSLTQADSGYYNMRKRDNTLLSRIQLIVKEHYRRYFTPVNERLYIQSAFVIPSWTVTFSPEGEMHQATLVRDGNLVIEDHWISSSFRGRIFIANDGIEINPVEKTDNGVFEFRDPQGNLIQTVQVKVNDEKVSILVHVAVVVGVIFVVIVCCCCVRKCCCKKSSSKRDKSAPQTAAAPAVYYHDQNQPAGPSYSAAPAPHYSYQPVNVLASKEPATASLGPSVYNPVNIHVNPLQPEVAAPGGQGGAPAPPLSSDCLSSDPEPKFELKGLTFPSAPPLFDSDSTLTDVYTSDKLNFL